MRTQTAVTNKIDSCKKLLQPLSAYSRENYSRCFRTQLISLTQNFPHTDPEWGFLPCLHTLAVGSEKWIFKNLSIFFFRRRYCTNYQSSRLYRTSYNEYINSVNSQARSLAWFFCQHTQNAIVATDCLLFLTRFLADKHRFSLIKLRNQS